MNICIAGGRSFHNRKFIAEHLDSILAGREFTIVSGGAKGVDRAAEYYAKERDLELIVIKANWDKYRKNAGMIRNKEMAKISDVLIAFWDQESKGTGHMIRTMTQLKKPVFIVDITFQC